MLKIVSLIFCVIYVFWVSLSSAQQMTTLPQWQAPTPVFSQKFDWLKLKSNEWLAGEIISMYDNELEFDSDNLGVKFFDWEDVFELRSRYDQKIRLSDGTIVQGFLLVKDGHITIISQGTEQYFPLSELLSITSAVDNRYQLWDAKISLGLNLSQGNTNQLDYLVSAQALRKTPSNRFNIDFLYNYSKSSNNDITTVTINNHKLTAYFDWFYSTKVFLRTIEYENSKDLQQNIKAYQSVGSSLGYHLFNSKRIAWDFTVGPIFQYTQYNDNVGGKTEEGGALNVNTLFEYQISSQIDYTFDYQLKFVSDTLGEKNHHLKTGFDVELTDNFDIQLLFYLDRINKPISVDPLTTPKSNDYRLVFTIGYRF